MKFKVGDRVQIKTWKEMEKEYGLDKDGDIRCRNVFNTDMKHLCGTFATISRIGQNGCDVYLQDFTAKGRTFFSYTLDMLKPAKDEKKYRVGDKVQYNGSTYEITKEHVYKENTDKYEIHIMSDGNKTTAVYKKNGEVVSRSESNLHPDDEFNFKTGAQIAFDRVFQPEPENKEPEKSLRLFSFTGKCYGTVGTPTKYKDINGRPLFVGDIVEIENAPISPMQFVCEDDDGAFICGIKKSCDTKTGTIRNWKITLATPFTEVKDGTKVALTTCRLK